MKRKNRTNDKNFMNVPFFIKYNIRQIQSRKIKIKFAMMSAKESANGG